MKFYYPVIVKKTENGYHAKFADLEMCDADGDTLDEVLDNAKDAAYNWIEAELQEPDPQLPPSSDKADLEAEAAEDEIVREILVTYRMMEGWEE